MQRRTARLRGARVRRRVVDADAPSTTQSTPTGDPVHRYPVGGPAVRVHRTGADEGGVRSAGHEIAARDTAGVGSPRAAAPGHGSSVRLEGRTDADFAGSTYRTVGGTTRPATSCDSCGADECQRVTGNVVMTFRVTTTVTLPTPDPNLTPCQLTRVRNAIRNILAPHEQRHVRAFNTYNGSVTKPFNLTLCSGDFDAAIKDMFDAVEGPRQAAAQARSDALDQPPFFFDVDLNCQEPPPQGQRPRGQAAADTSPAADTGPEAERPA